MDRYKVTLSFCVSPEIADWISETAHTLRLQRSEFIRTLVEDAMTCPPEQQKPAIKRRLSISEMLDRDFAEQGDTK